ncbi:hypothetical protein J7394_22675, partial [Ruegeria sp. R13_0]|uniref:hypothetical protein n=1 Tax=Ruegeria sp. R13_0 TaxID=2821099 RepID=UPI001ADBA051
GQINADCGNLHGVAPLISSLRQLHYDALRRPLEQEPSTPSGLAGRNAAMVVFGQWLVWVACIESRQQSEI